MERSANLILVDSDTRRRATITHALSASRVHVEPFESIAELEQSWPRAGIVLLHDEGRAIADLVVAMANHRDWFPVIAFSTDPDPARIVEAVLEGAIDYLTWPITSEHLAAALQSALDRAEKTGHSRLREAVARARIDRLTPREREVLRGVASGLSNRLIGERLSISPRTVEIHRANMLNKLGANHTSEAIRIAIEARLAD
ncbi:MAG: LuxR C-terminal-related transcriptional regulator [Novosphingobium sp.]|nr:LuxR C-terminal-related transcriptional regulator [Novosphingobium sp.]